MIGLETIGNKWIHPVTGEVRYYVNDAWKYGGLELEFYNSGNISDASLNGEGISNSKARGFKSCINKCWITEDGKVHVKFYGHEDFVDAVIAGVKKAIADLQPKEEAKTNKYSIIPCDENGAVDIHEDCVCFATIEEFKAGIREWAKNGWEFCGLHPWHMGANLNQIYVKKVA